MALSKQREHRGVYPSLHLQWPLEDGVDGHGSRVAEHTMGEGAGAGSPVHLVRDVDASSGTSIS